MSPTGGESLRIALLHHSYGSRRPGAGELIHRLAVGLRAAGHRPCVVTSHLGGSRTTVEDGIDVVRVRRLPESPLRLRGFTGPLTQLPATLRMLLRGDYAVAHAFSPPDALAALLWRARAGRPAIFTPTEPIERQGLADRRLRMWLVERAVEESDVVIAPSEEVRSALWRWLAVEPRVIESDGVAHAGAYREAMSRRGGSPIPQRR